MLSRRLETPSWRNAHHILTPAIFGIENTPESIWRRIASTASEAVRVSEKKLANCLAQFSNSRARILFLSSEMFFVPFADNAIESLATRAERHGAQLRATAYLRNPAEFLVSSLQAQLRTSGSFTAYPGNLRIATLKPWHENSRVCCIFRKFPEKNAAPLNPAIELFNAAVPDVALPAHWANGHLTNSSLSAEALQLLQERLQKQPSRKNLRARISNYVWWHRLAKADGEIPGRAKLALLPHWYQYVLSNCTDLFWLKDRLGIDFTDIGPSDEPTANPDMPDLPHKINDLCRVDQMRLTTLRERLIRL